MINQLMKQQINQPKQTISSNSRPLIPSVKVQPDQPTNQPFSQHSHLLSGSMLPPIVGSCQTINQWTINQGSLLGSTPPSFSRLLPSNQAMNHQSGFSYRVHPSQFQQPPPSNQSINRQSWFSSRVHSSPLQMDFVNKPPIKLSTYQPIDETIIKSINHSNPILDPWYLVSRTSLINQLTNHSVNVCASCAGHPSHL